MFALLCLGVGVAVQPTASENLSPRTAPPRMVFVHAVAPDGTVELLNVVQKPVTVTEQRPMRVFQNGVESTRMETFMVVKYVSESMITRFDARAGRVQTVDGKPIALADLASRLNKGDVALLAAGDTVDDAWLRPLKPDTVLLFSTPATKSAVPAPAPGRSPAPKPDSEASETETTLLSLTNAERLKAGAPPLEASPLLFRAARLHAANMAKQGVLHHTLDGKGVSERLNDLGYGWIHCAENIAKGQRTPEDVISSWMQSPGHRDNLLSTENTQIGLAMATGTDGQQYWTMVLGRPK